MLRAQRILWGEGMFLRPQHFQQEALLNEHNLAKAMRQSQAYPWGVRKVELDTDALQSGLLRLDELELTFQDGAFVEAPRLNPLPEARDLNKIPQVGTEALVYACLPTLNAFGRNCADADTEVSRPARYTIERSNAADLYTSALEAEVSALHPNLRLLLTQENRDGHHCIPVARIEKNANGTWQLDSSFTPPLTAIAGSHHINIMLRRLLDIMIVKSQALAAKHRERVKSVVEYGTSDIASFWLLHTVNRTFPLLKHYTTSATHPEVLYTTLAQLCGELMTFSSTLSLTEIPVYDHENPTEIFQKLDTLIRELLETVVSNRFAIIPLDNTKPSFYVGRLDSERLVENVDYYLSISSDMPTTEILDTVPMKLKVGSADDVEKILNSALPGVRLSHATQTPTALPVRVGNHYFVLEPKGQIFERMITARSICIYIPQSLLQLQLELIAVFR